MSVIPNIDTIKSRMRDAWNAGDYGKFAAYMEPGAGEILKGWRIPQGLEPARCSLRNRTDIHPGFHGGYKCYLASTSRLIRLRLPGDAQ